MKEKIRALADELGFTACGFTHAGTLVGESEHLSSWLDNGYHAEMMYMENHFEKRLTPSLLVEDAKSVITLLYNYYPQKLQRPDAPQIAKYAYGEDYHFVLKEKLFELQNRINSEITPINGRAFTDSAPVLERALAVRAGLGWIGKNSLLINKKLGSFFMIGELVIDLEIEPDQPFDGNYCGNCNRCVESCPTGAILENGVINSNNCISYLSIEKRGDFTENTPSLNDQMFGCDICQDVCPWNSKAVPNDEERFTPHPDLLSNSREQWENLEEEQFRKIFRKSAVKRTKYGGLMRNIRNISKHNL